LFIGFFMVLECIMFIAIDFGNITEGESTLQYFMWFGRIGASFGKMYFFVTSVDKSSSKSLVSPKSAGSKPKSPGSQRKTTVQTQNNWTTASSSKAKTNT